MGKNHNLSLFIATLLCATFLMGSSFVAGKVLIIDGFPALSLVAWRFFAAALMIFPYALWKNNCSIGAFFPKNFGARDWFIVFLIGLFQTAGALGLMFISMETISAPNAAILLFTNPLWVAVLGAIFLHEHLKPLRIAGLIIGIIGVFLAIGANIHGFNNLGGQILGLSAAISWAISSTINKKFAPHIETFALSFWQMFLGSLVLLGFAFALGQKAPDSLDLRQISWFIWLAGPGSAISFSLWFVALRQGGATNASSYLFLAPLFAILISFIVLGTKLTAIQGIGGALIFAAIWLINHNPEKPNSISKFIEAQSEGT